MAFGGHELLLIIRGQNQASAALGRVRRDLLGLERMRDLQARKSALERRAAMQQMRVMSATSPLGTKNLQIQRAQLRIANQVAAIHDRDATLDVRRMAIASRANQLVRQREVMEQRISALGTNRLNIEARELRMQQQIMATEGKIAALQSGSAAGTVRGAGYERASISRYASQTTVLRRQLALQRLTDKGPSETDTGGVHGQRVTIAQRDLNAAVRSAALAAAEVGKLSEAEALLTTTLGSQKAALGAVQAEYAGLAEKEVLIRKRIDDLQFAWNSLNAREQAVIATENVHKAQLAELNVQLTALTSKTMEVAAATQLEEAALAQTNAELREMNMQIKLQPLEKMQAVARSVSHVGRVMQMTGLITTAAFGAMAINAAKFNTEAIRASTQTGKLGSGADVIVKNADRISAAIMKMMTEIPADQTQLTDVFYNIYSSMNATLPQGVKLAKLFGQVWVAGGMRGDINEVADALITLGNNWKISANDMGAWNNLASKTLATVRFGRLDVQQYTQTMNQLAPAFKGAHQSIDQMNAAIAFNTRLMPSQRMSAAGVARMMEVLARFAAKPAAGFEDTAKAIQNAQGNLKPLNQVLAILIARYPKLKSSGVFLKNFFKTVSNQQGTVQARRAFQNFINQTGLYNDTLKNITGDQNEFNRSLRAMEKSTGVQWAQFVNDAKAFALELGTGALPALLRVTAQAQRLVKWFENLDPTTKRAIGYFGAFTAAALLLGGTLLTVAGALGSMVIAARIGYLILQGRGIASFLGFAGAAEKIAANAGEAGIAARGLGGEVGAVSPKLIIAGGAITTIVSGLIIFRKQIIGVVQQLGGLHLILATVATALTVFTSAKVALWLAGIAAKLIEARLGVAGLRGAIAALSALRLAPIVIPIAILWQLKTNKVLDATLGEYGARAAQYVHNKVKGTPVIGGILGKLTTPTEYAQKKIQDYNTRKNFGMSPSEYYNIQNNRDVTRLSTQSGLNERISKAAKVRQQTIRQANAAIAKSSKQAAAAQNYKDVQVQWQKMIPTLKRLKAATEAAPADVQKNLAYLQYQDKLQKLLKAQPNLYNAIMNSISATDSASNKADKAETKRLKNQAKLQKTNIDNAKQLLKTYTDNVSNMYDTILQQNQTAASELFSGPFVTGAKMQDNIQWGHILNAEDLQHDLGASLSKFNHWNRDLSKLIKRGAPKEMVDQIRELGPEQQKNVEALIKMKPEQWAKYKKTFLKEQAAVKTATMKQLNSQLKGYQSHGRKIAQAIIAGIKSEDVALQNTFKGMIEKMFPGLAKQAHPTGKKPAKPTVNHTEHNTYNVTTSDKASVKAQLRHATLARRNTYMGPH